MLRPARAILALTVVATTLTSPSAALAASSSQEMYGIDRTGDPETYSETRQPTQAQLDAVDITTVDIVESGDTWTVVVTRAGDDSDAGDGFNVSVLAGPTRVDHRGALSKYHYRVSVWRQPGGTYRTAYSWQNEQGEYQTQPADSCPVTVETRARMTTFTLAALGPCAHGFGNSVDWNVIVGAGNEYQWSDAFRSNGWMRSGDANTHPGASREDPGARRGYFVAPWATEAAPAEPTSRDVEDTCFDRRTSSYGDVGEGNAHNGTISCIGGYEITNGKGDGSYDPGGRLTRAQTATFIRSTLNAASANVPDATTTSCDGPRGVHTPNIEALVEAGIVSPDACTGGTITRAQMADWVDNALRFAGVADPTDVPDYYADDNGHEAEPSINRITARGIVTGQADGTFGADLSLTRAQMATFLARALDVMFNLPRS